jgi:hypothetical protein
MLLMERFPDDASVARLAALHVSYILIHQRFIARANMPI